MGGLGKVAWSEDAGFIAQIGEFLIETRIVSCVLGIA
jgi:hypothetical protein